MKNTGNKTRKTAVRKKRKSAAKAGVDGRTAKAATSTKTARRPKPISESATRGWTMRLYIAGDTPKSVTAQQNLQRLCERYLPGKYTIEIIDLIEHPELARADQVLAIPTLVRKMPVPIKRIIGDLSNEERAMLALDVRDV